MRIAMLLSAVMLCTLLGCSDKTQKRHYEITVKNETPEPITIWLTKEGPPVEAGWRSPEQLAMVAPAHEERIGGLVVPPGKTAETGTLEGKFMPGAYAWLRVYEGQRRFSEILAISRGDPSRLDLPLTPGRNELVIRRKTGQLVAVPLSDALPTNGQLRLK